MVQVQGWSFSGSVRGGGPPRGRTKNQISGSDASKPSGKEFFFPLAAAATALFQRLDFDTSHPRLRPGWDLVGDITHRSTVEAVLGHFEGQLADLVVCEPWSLTGTLLSA